MGAFRKWLIIAFCSLQAGFLIFSLIPRDWGVRQAVQKPILDPWHVATNSLEWHMFRTIPPIHHLEARLTLGEEALPELGPILPGLRPYETPRDARLYYTVDRMLIQGHEAYVEAWRQQVAEEVEQQELDANGMQISRDFTRSLTWIQRDGVVSQTREANYPLKQP